jgi:hypothetical protein
MIGDNFRNLKDFFYKKNVDDNEINKKLIINISEEDLDSEIKNIINRESGFSRIKELFTYEYIIIIIFIFIV